MRVIALINQKGGTGKTTTCINLGAALALCGFKCLLIDIDPQGNLSQSLGFDDLHEKEVTIYEVLKGESVNRAVRTKTEGSYSYDVIPTDIRLSGTEVELVEADNRNNLLKRAINRLRTSYDYILIDCPPSLNILTLMALNAATEVIIPVQAQYLALRGVAQIRDTLDLVKERFNPGLKICGVLVTFYDNRRNLDKEVKEALEQAFPRKVFKTTISSSIKFAESPSYGQDIFSYSPKSKGAYQYQELAKEVIAHETTERK